MCTNFFKKNINANPTFAVCRKRKRKPARYHDFFVVRHFPSTSKGRFNQRCLLLLPHIRSAHLEILGFPMGGTY